ESVITKAKNIALDSVLVPNEDKLQEYVKIIQEMQIKGKNLYSQIWEIYDKSNVGSLWRKKVLNDEDSAFYNRNLDVLIKLLQILFEENQANLDLTFTDFENRIDELNFQEDNLKSGKNRDYIHLLTPASTIGRHFKYVFIIDLNDGLWPNLKRRSKNLHWDYLSQFKVYGEDWTKPGAMDQHLELLDQELYLYNVSKTRALNQTIVCAIKNDDVQPSQFFTGDFEDIETTKSDNLPDVNTISAFAYQMRQDNETEILATLKYLRESEANPQNWLGNLQKTDQNILLYDEDENVVLSPSKVETLINCPLRYSLEKCFGVSDQTANMTIGSMVHEIAEEIAKEGKEKVENRLQIMQNKLDIKFNQAMKDAQIVEESEVALNRYRAEKMLLALDEYFSKSDPVWEQGSDLTEDKTKENEVIPKVDAAVEFKIGGTKRENIQLSNTVSITGNASIDRIEKSLTGYTIVDFKTGGAISFAEAQTNPQLMTYQLSLKYELEKITQQNKKKDNLLENKYPNTVPSIFQDMVDSGSIGARLVYLKNGELKERYKKPIQNEEEAKQEIDTARAELSNKRGVPAKINPKCQHCSLQSSCALQKGRQVVE
ncbi:MAG: PD-(D/E)XK nuclease family protein, partial [Candidatus Ancillula sp.]|nr:PD-(D/E)XK nuclease family protein [Candidatus Ancillula sp.]